MPSEASPRRKISPPARRLPPTCPPSPAWARHTGTPPRAALESIAYQSADLIRAMEADCKGRLRELRVDGGATVNNPLMQFQAELLRVPVVRPRITETTALGAACLAGLAVGYWKDRSELARLWQVDRTFRARLPARATHERLAAWHRAVERVKNPRR